MTAKANRVGYEAEVMAAKTLYLRRAHPKDPVELVVGWGDHTCTIVALTESQHKALARDAIGTLLTTSVFA